ncbi:nucleotide/nucleic acid-binding septum formation-inhibiting protein [Citrifermentans bemidjiense Bem]|uniref:dTTP/UTP pyrophosphatase n=1 Tax=Citrifermentans bemidjiense (strain ATCC BAA-1014 / DSM 16622 / JCM 12645 / Bem) TaxID=404380 RepID=NTPPA_CITBB|nr:Maf family nucleotide pyrophosphatase [Citrifermentans bemidjiense]B5EHR3.1 RecName: Full=dTTP/UTP pyrophosphatase; Short=dTTPase/UTPase; AltName: Full=Nucleoside triphosphate pyrophosphatase; AltName: Full=Nucleotide pyrophosphatase; Short=Nucleotide PPase [Citrifermentans bemidjiense Bem]ACH39712.1 nucleotide/nucleic acid-binding septum formation-inhibiting protein [Citrifermentans bemidjiense Bem]
MKNSSIVLASASPRRSELLESAGIQFRVVPADINEEPFPGEEPVDHVQRLAEGKARAAAELAEGRFFLGADTIVLCDGEIMGKPKDAADAKRMLNKLSGVPHEVVTGFAIYDRERKGAVVEAIRTKVFFKKLRDEEILDYIATGCPFDKAGAYAIQGGAAHMVQKIEGSYTNVVGLPLCEVVDALRVIGALGN